MEEVMMQKVGSLLALVLFFSVAAAAQETPRFEVFGGYSFLSADLNDSNFNLNGFHVSAAENLNKWVGGVLDFSTHYGTFNGVNVNMQSIMYGPRFAYRKSKVVTPSAHALFGVVRGSAGFDGISKADTHFGLALGGEIDVRINQWVALRVVQADYIMTNFVNTRQDNIRISAGLVFRFH
jgi:hypothetical protein